MKGDDAAPTTWSEPQRRVLRFVRDEGGWFTNWNQAPGRAAREAVAARTGATFQREHGLHECPWYEPHTGKARLLQLAAALTDPADLVHVRNLPPTPSGRRRGTRPSGTPGAVVVRTTAVEYRVVRRDGQVVGVGTTEDHDTALADLAAWRGDGYDVTLQQRTCSPWQEVDR